jgi:hypothetical protein
MKKEKWKSFPIKEWKSYKQKGDKNVNNEVGKWAQVCHFLARVFNLYFGQNSFEMNENNFLTK